MGLLQNDKAVFYHPLDDADEVIEAKTWSGTSDTSAGKVGQAMSRVDISANLGGSSGDYSTVVGETRVAFCGWFQKPSEAPSQTAAPTVDAGITDGDTSASGTGVNGATVEVFVDDVSAGNADAAVSGGTWSKTGMSSLSTGEVVSARQRSTGELQSNESNEVTVAVGGPSVGAQSEFLSTEARGTSVTRLDATHVFVAYGNTSDVYGKVGTVTGSSIAFGGDQGFGGTNGEPWVDCDTLDSTHVVVVWKFSNTEMRARIGVISGTSISVPSSYYQVHTANIGYPHVAALDSSHFVAVGREGTSNAFARVGDTSGGTTISWGTRVEMQGTNAIYTCVAAISSTKFVAVYVDVATWGGKARVGTVSGTSISFGTVATWKASDAYYEVAVADLGDGEHVVLAYGQSGSSVVKVGTVAGGGTGTTISFGSDYEFQNQPVECELGALSTGKIMVAYRDGYDGSKAKVREGVVSGTTVSFGGASDGLNAAGLGSEKYSVAGISSTQAVVTYEDASDGSHGTANVVTAVL